MAAAVRAAAAPSGSRIPLFPLSRRRTWLAARRVTVPGMLRTELTLDGAVHPADRRPSIKGFV